MTVLAHGAYGPADELGLLVPVVVAFVLALVSLRRRNARSSEEDIAALPDQRGIATSGDGP